MSAGSAQAHPPRRSQVSEGGSWRETGRFPKRRSALAELRRLARLVQAGLLALDLARVALQEALPLERDAEVGIDLDERASDAVPTAPAWPLGPPPWTRTRRSY